MPRGRYSLHDPHDHTPLAEEHFQCAPGPSGWRYVSQLTTPGGDHSGSVDLTLKREAQDAAFNGLQALGSGVEGAVVAIEPSTGRILAMATSPSYDPNKLASHDLSSVTDAYDKLSSDPGQPLLNRAIQTRLPPGSTFKVVTAAAALESGNYDAGSMVPGGPTYQLPLTHGDR